MTVTARTTLFIFALVLGNRFSQVLVFLAGGVAANATLRRALAAVSAVSGTNFFAPPLRLCTDNAAMIAWVGIERFAAGRFDRMDLIARPRWPLDQSAAPMIGSGKRGAKA